MNKHGTRTGASILVLLFSVVFGIFIIYTNSTQESASASETLPSATPSSTAPPTTAHNPGYTISADVPSTMEIGQTQAIIAQTVPFTPAVDILWYSSNSEIADVSLTGVITALSVGSVEIYATTLDPDSHASITMTYTVTITESGENRPPIGNNLLRIANNNNILMADFIPDDLVLIGTSVPTMNDGIMLTRNTLEAYISMYRELKKADVGELYIISGYRSYTRQSELFEARVDHFLDEGHSPEDAEYRAALTVNRPGSSEHQLGVSIDVSTDGSTQHDFHTLPQGAWIKENAHRFGFIIRYPEDKTDITGINYEPWHLRYVGTDHSVYIYEHDLCLEEYIKL